MTFRAFKTIRCKMFSQNSLKKNTEKKKSLNETATTVATVATFPSRYTFLLVSKGKSSDVSIWRDMEKIRKKEMTHSNKHNAFKMFTTNNFSLFFSPNSRRSMPNKLEQKLFLFPFCYYYCCCSVIPHSLACLFSIVSEAI